MYPMKPAQPIIYVTREIERAIGMPPGPNYLIVADRPLTAKA